MGNVPHKGKILLMDDKTIILVSVSHALMSIGYEVTAASHGEEVLKHYADAVKEKTPFDVVILDIINPGGMGGKETFERLVKIDPNVKAIASSGNTDNPIMSEYKKCGFRENVIKPYDIDELDRAIQRVIRANN